jgi:phage terminase large subunit-like protein
MLANLPKRKLADAWALETTTAPAPGDRSIAEDTMEYAQQVADGRIKDSKLFFFHRQASDQHDLETQKGLRAAIVEASGPVADWSDITGILEQWQDPRADTAFLERVWLNRPVQASAVAFDVLAWEKCARPDGPPAAERLITLGFDGARFRDATALVGADVEAGYLFMLGLWERPAHVDEWEVPVADVRAAVDAAFAQWNVWRMYADPPYWEETVNHWAGKYGEDRVVEWWTNRPKAIGHACRAFAGATLAGELAHDGDVGLTRHVGNAARKSLRARDDEDRPLWAIQKQRPDSPRKIDAAMAAVLAWEARGDAIASGAVRQTEPSRYEEEGAELAYI